MSGPFKSRKKALLAAVDQYPPDSGLAPLKYAEADALALDELLRRKGFETILLRGAAARRDDIEATLLQCAQESGGLFLFYFSGHGQLIRGSLHLHPADSDRSGLRALAFDHCHRAWQTEFGYERVVAILDACRSELSGTKGPLPHTAEAARNIRAATQGRRQVEVLYGCSEGQVSFEDDDLRHGVFTNCLLKAFQAHPRYLDTDLLAGATVDFMEEWGQKDSLQRYQRAQRYHVPTLKNRIVLLGDPELAVWLKAQENNSVEPYQAYPEQHRDGAHAPASQATLRGLHEAAAWAKAQTENTAEACEEFLAEWRDGLFAADAKQTAAQLKAEDEEWQATRQADDLDRYRAFLNGHAGSRHATAARRRLQEIEADDEAWATAKQTQAIEVVEDYLTRTLEERHRPEALAWKRAFEDNEAWAKVSQARNLASVRDYQVTFGPNARHVAEAGQLRQALEAEEAARLEAARQAEEACRAEAQQVAEEGAHRRRTRRQCWLALLSLGLVVLASVVVYHSVSKAERVRAERAEMESKHNQERERLRVQLAEAQAKQVEQEAELSRKVGEITQKDRELNNLKEGTNVQAWLFAVGEKIADLEKKLRTPEADREFLRKELHRLETERTELARQQDDLLIIKSQVAKLKQELAVARRIEFSRLPFFSGSNALKGAERLMRKSTNVPSTNFNLNVEFRASASARPELRLTMLLELGSGVTLEVCGIPAGEFLMGSTKAEREWAAGPEGQGKPEMFTDEGEAPRLTRIRQGFWLGRTEVTVGQLKRFVTETSYRTDAETAGRAWCFDWTSNRWGIVEGRSWRDPNYGFAVRDDHPVACVSWNDAMAFCKWLTEKLSAAGSLPQGMECRLPTEAEWEYACRGGRQGTKFWWGDTVAHGQGRLNAASEDRLGPNMGTWSAKFPWSDGYALVSPVDAYGAQGRNGFGLADMLGNVWEWCLDGWNASGAQEECYTGNTGRRVLRGGAFADGPGVARCADRGTYRPPYATADYGFRVCVGVGR